METEVYGDLLFLINAGMDALCFLLTARLLRRRVSAGRVLLGSVLGGVYAVLALLPELSPAAALACDLGACLLICLPVFLVRRDGAGRFFAAVGVYAAVSLLLGGVMTGLYNLLNRSGLSALLSDAGGDGPTAWVFALLALAGGGVTLWGGRLFRRAGAARPCRVTILLDGRSVTLNGLSDSGNLLRDPVGGLPVIPVDAEAVRLLLSPALCRVLAEGGSAPDAETLAKAPEARRVRLIPADSVGGQTLLTALRPDAVRVTAGVGSGRERTVDADALIAPMRLPDGDAPGGRPQAIVPAQLLPG